MVVTLGQQYNIGEKPTVILYIYINRHAGTPEKTELFTVSKPRYITAVKPCRYNPRFFRTITVCH